MTVTMKVVETTTIKAKFAALPCIDTSNRYLVEVLEPVPLIPVIKVVYPVEFRDNKNVTLEDVLLHDWHSQLKLHGADTWEQLPQWMKDVDKVELIECDLLVPKERVK